MAVLSKIINVVFGDPYQKKIKLLQPIIDTINSLEPTIQMLSDEQLQAKTAEFKHRLSKGETLENILPESFAVVREAAKRALNMRHFDVQLVGGIALHQGKIAEMKTGEGKTLVAPLAAYLNALEGKGVYIVTVNEYLAKRDSEWMGKIYKFLGLTVGLTIPGMPIEQKRESYHCDIVYGTNNEFGFDYLRDNLCRDINQCVQNRLHYAIVDEVDSILIDEARTPLIISGPVKDPTSKYKRVVQVIRKLSKNTHFTTDEKHKNVVLTEEGIIEIEKAFGLSNIYSIQNMDVAHMAVQCLKALYLFKKDVDYVIKNGEVQIVDEFTGRILEGRRYSDGLHQAIEAVENVRIQEESQTLASITFQNYFRMFKKLAGMTGTAITEEAEFGKIYNLEVMPIPTNKPMIRKDAPDVIYKNKEAKYKAIAEEVKELHKKGQPVLVGTISIENSEILSDLFRKNGIPHSVLNAKHHEKEAEIVAKAGQSKTVTIATNMAGRGTDIVLGDAVKNLGGLHILGSERHESRRIDNQLRGRSGRQGDNGSSRFYVALDDDLMRLFGSDRIAKIMNTLGLPDDTPIEHVLISRSIEKAQKKVEQYYFSIRKQILEYDNVLNKQRETIYNLRKQILKKTHLDDKLKEFIETTINGVLDEFFDPNEHTIKLEDNKECIKDLENIFNVQNLEQRINHFTKRVDIINHLKKEFENILTTKKMQYPPQIWDEVMKEVMLMNLDRKWMDNLHNMDILREGIGLRAWGQRDPLIEYKIESYNLFKELMESVAGESLEMIFKLTLVEEKPVKPIIEISPAQMFYNKTANGPAAAIKKKAHKVGRNDDCPCGSGKKYKKCCGI